MQLELYVALCWVVLLNERWFLFRLCKYFHSGAGYNIFQTYERYTSPVLNHNL